MKIADLNKYTNFGNFVFRLTDNLGKVCNAPEDKAGIYIIYALKNFKSELIYIGQSGRVNKEGNLFVRKDGIKGRLVNGKRDNEPRKNYWIREMTLDKIDALEIYWFVTHNDEYIDCPLLLEKKLIKNYNPRWNRK